MGIKLRYIQSRLTKPTPQIWCPTLPPSMEIHTDESLCQVPERSVLLRGGGCGGAQPPLELLRARHVGPPPARPLPRQRRAQRPRPRGRCGQCGRGRLRHGEPELEARRHGRHLCYNQQQIDGECFMAMLFSSFLPTSNDVSET